jgi:lysozyme
MPRKKSSEFWSWIIVVLFFLLVSVGLFLSTFQKKINRSLGEYTRSAPPYREELKLQHVFRNFPEGILGIDVSQYQGRINFAGLQLQLENQRVQFVFVRATMGEDGIDARFQQNWKGFSNLPVKRGAYHYYRPNENSSKQAQNYIRHTRLTKGDLIPVLDIEKHSTIQPKEKLREGLKNWLKIVEAHYKVKPMIYTGDRFFWEVLHNQGFDNYPIWVANYNRVLEPHTSNWVIWQFSEKGSLPGIGAKVDLNVLRGGRFQLQKLKIPVSP